MMKRKTALAIVAIVLVVGALSFALFAQRVHGASCPTVLCPLGTNQWVNEGRILEGVNAAQKERSDSLLLRGFDGRLQIREEDRETSYLRVVHVVNVCNDGTQQELSLKDSPFTGTKPLVLHRGDHLQLDFLMLQKPCGRDYKVIATGYYLPD